MEPVQTTSEQPPWDDVYEKIEICCTVPQLNSKDEANIISQKALTLEMIEEKYCWNYLYNTLMYESNIVSMDRDVVLLLLNNLYSILKNIFPFLTHSIILFQGHFIL